MVKKDSLCYNFYGDDMNKYNKISVILYFLAIICFFGYLITKKSGLMACGGLLMIFGAIFMIIAKNRK